MRHVLVIASIFLLALPVSAQMATRSTMAPGASSTLRADFVVDADHVVLSTGHGSLLIDVAEGVVLRNSELPSHDLALQLFTQAEALSTRDFAIEPERTVLDDLEEVRNQRGLAPDEFHREFLDLMIGAVSRTGPVEGLKMHQGQLIRNVSLTSVAEMEVQQCVADGEAKIQEARLKDLLSAAAGTPESEAAAREMVEGMLLLKGVAPDQVNSTIDNLMGDAARERERIDGGLAQEAKRKGNMREVPDIETDPEPFTEEEVKMLIDLGQMSPPLQIVGQPPVQTAPGTIGAGVIGAVGQLLIERGKTAEDQGPDQSLRLYVDYYNGFVCASGGCPE